jgi:hypothetical protein
LFTRPLVRHTLYLKSVFGQITRHRITAAEGEQLVESKQAARVVRLVKGRYELVGYQMKERLRADHSSPTAITCREMIANAGMAESGAINAARGKVEAWPILTAYFRNQMTVSA